MRSKLETTMAVALAATTIATPITLRAQDRVNVSIVAPTLGAIPQLSAGTFEILNQSALTYTSGSGGSSMLAGNSQPAHVQMSLPWGGEAAQFLEALESGSASTFTTVTCAFYHPGSSTPYYTVTMHTPVIERVALAYDSAAGIATEELRFAAKHVDYSTGTSGSGSATPTPPPSIAPQTVMIAGRQVHVFPARAMMVSRIASAVIEAGPPMAGFAAFTSSSGAMPSEGGTPPWAGTQSTSVSTFTVDMSTPVDAASGLSTGKVTITPVKFTKPVGSLSAQLQAARAAHTPLTTVISLADRPGRLAYRITLTNGVIQSDQTSFSGGKSAEEIAVAAQGMKVADLVRGTQIDMH